MTINFEKIESKHKKIIDIARNYMSSIADYEHNLKHTLDVVDFCKELLVKLNIKNVDIDCVIISCYWHDVGRTIIQDGHEKVSAEMLKKELLQNGYPKDFADKCYECVEFHKYDMTPAIIEGHILKDSDKLAFLGWGRWSECVEHNQNLDVIMSLLPKLRDELLFFDESKKIYDKQIVKILEMLYKRTKNDNNRKS